MYQQPVLTHYFRLFYIILRITEIDHFSGIQFELVFSITTSVDQLDIPLIACLGRTEQNSIP